MFAAGAKKQNRGAYLEKLRVAEKKRLAGILEWCTDAKPIHHYRLAKDLSDVANASGDPVFICDGGNWVAMAAKVIELRKPGRWLDPGPLGCLGVGAPFALAAKSLHPERTIFVIQGDGSFGLNGFDFETAVRFKLPMVCVVGNDAAWGQIRIPQVGMFGEDKVARDAAGSDALRRGGEGVRRLGRARHRAVSDSAGAGARDREQHRRLRQRDARPRSSREGRRDGVRGLSAMHRFRREAAALLIVDVQERLCAAMRPDALERMLYRTCAAIDGAKALGIPIIVTEQYPKGLGHTVKRVAERIDGFAPIEKLEFSALVPLVREQLASRPLVLVAGMETHVCVFQTVRDLVDLRLTPYLAVDAVVSRAAADFDAGLALCRDSGAVMTTVETALFDALGKAQGPEFKAVSAAVK